MKSLLFVFILLSFMSCGGGGSSSGGSVTYNEIIKSPQFKCGANDCISGQALSLSSLALGAGDEFSNFQDDYNQIKTALSRIQEEIANFNRLATEEELASCDDIPTTGSVSVPGTKVTEFSFFPGDETFDLGDGMIAMQKKISVSTDGSPLMLLQLACNGTTQTVHILNSGINANMGVDEKVLFEAFYQIDSASGKITLQFVEIMGTVYRTMASFKTNGGIDFDVSGFVKNGTGGSSSYSSFSSVGFDDAAFPIGALEMVYSTTQGVGLDAVNFGSVAGQERVCVYGYSSAPVFDDSASCYNNATKSALLPTQGNLLGAGPATWDTTYLDAINIVDINP